jgi:hypothetical protein
MVFLRKHWLFLSILIVGLVVRFIFIAHQGLSNDELSAWFRTRYNSWDEFWFFGIKNGDMHPSFYQVLLWIWVRIFGDSELSLRLTSLLFYIFNSFLIYQIACRHFTRLSGLLLQGLYAGLTFTVINTVLARPYNSGTFFLLMTFLAVLEMKKLKTISWKWILLCALGIWGAMISHYFAFFTIIILGGCSLFYIGKERLKYILLAGLIALILFLPHLSITTFQVGRGGLQWLNTPKFEWPLEFIQLFFNNSLILFGILLVLFSVLIIVYGVNKWTKEATFGISVFILVFCGAFIVSHLFTPILRELVMLFVLPFLFLPLLSLLKIPKKLSIFVVAFITFLPLTDSFIRNKLLEPIHYGDFKEIGKAINSAVEVYSKDSITFASSYNNVGYINYYLKENLSETIINWENPETVYQLAERVKLSDTPYFCYSVNNDFHSQMFLEVIRRKYPVIVQSLFVGNSKFVLFGRKGKRNFENPFLKGKIVDTVLTSNEFFNDISTKVADLPAAKTNNSYFLITSKGENSPKNPLYLIVTLERNGSQLMNGEYPVLYAGYNQSQLTEEKGEQDFYCVFQLPEGTLPSDNLKIYFWNPEKGKVKTQQLNCYLIDDLELKSDSEN